MDKGKFAGRLRKEMIFPPNKKTEKNIMRLKNKLIIRDRPRRFTDSLSDFGSTIASSYLNEDNIIIIPTKLRYTEYIPNDSGEKNLLSIG